MDAEETHNIKKISKHEFYFETALYEVVNFIQLEEDILSGEVDWYSPQNRIDTTYKISSTYKIDIDAQRLFSGNQYTDEDVFFWVQLICKRKWDEVLRFYIYVTEEGTLVKIWQYPSLVDIQFSELGTKYDKVLPKEDIQNLKRAIGLFAHWVWAWSFVYLRRIFENLVFETYKNNKAQIKLSEKDFIEKRMQEKISVLKEYLPSQLVKLKSIYSILSKWVHELSEVECLQYFSAIKLSIELILDQKIKMKEEQDKEDRIQKEIQAIQQKIS